MNIILASASPRRREILTTLGLDFSVLVPNVDEHSSVTDPSALVCDLAKRKGRGALDMLRRGHLPDQFPTAAPGEDTLIISSDTLVLCDREILGKPRDRDDALRMLRLLSGREHMVYSGIALTLLRADGSSAIVSDTSATEVRFGRLTDAELELYLSRCQYMDKAGAYAIQEGASMFIDGIRGDFFTVMGLPVRCMYRLARRGLGIDLQKLCHKIN